MSGWAAPPTPPVAPLVEEKKLFSFTTLMIALGASIGAALLCFAVVCYTYYKLLPARQRRRHAQNMARVAAAEKVEQLAEVAPAPRVRLRPQVSSIRVDDANDAMSNAGCNVVRPLSSAGSDAIRPPSSAASNGPKDEPSKMDAVPTAAELAGSDGDTAALASAAVSVSASVTPMTNERMAELEAEVRDMRSKELVAALEVRGLATDGKKKVMRERLLESMRAEMDARQIRPRTGDAIADDGNVSQSAAMPMVIEDIDGDPRQGRTTLT